MPRLPLRPKYAACRRSRSTKHCTMRDLPIPASPTIRSSHLTFAFEGTFPAIHQQTQFVLAPTNGVSPCAAGGRLKPPSDSAGLDYR